jgi:hypothetical protein
MPPPTALGQWTIVHPEIGARDGLPNTQLRVGGAYDTDVGTI